MSRWRETLCGTVVLAPANRQEQGGIPPLGASSEVLSCGGVFLASSKNRPLKKRDPLMFHLPKSHYEVVVVHPANNPARYGENFIRELEDDLKLMEDDSAQSLDTKLIK